MIRHHRGEVSTWLINDLDQVKGGLVRLFTSAVRDPIVVVLLVGSMVALDPVLAALAVAVAAVLVMPLLVVGRRTRRLNRRMLDDLGRVMSFHTDALAALRTVKTYAVEDGVAGAYAQRNQGLRRSFLAVVRWGSLSGPIVTLGTGVLLLTVVAVGLARVSGGRMTTGTLVALISSLLLFARPASALASTWNSIAGGARRRDEGVQRARSPPRGEGRRDGRGVPREPAPGPRLVRLRRRAPGPARRLARGATWQERRRRGPERRRQVDAGGPAGGSAPTEPGRRAPRRPLGLRAGSVGLPQALRPRLRRAGAVRRQRVRERGALGSGDRRRGRERGPARRSG